MLIAAGLWGRRWFFPSQESRIQNRLTALAETVSFTAQEGNLHRLTRINKLGAFFATNVVVSFSADSGRRSFQGRDEIVQAALTARGQLRDLQVRFPDIKIQLQPHETGAIVYLGVLADVDGESDAVAQLLRVEMIQLDRDWLISRMEPVDPLGR